MKEERRKEERRKEERRNEERRKEERRKEGKGRKDKKGGKNYPTTQTYNNKYENNYYYTFRKITNMKTFIIIPSGK